MKTPTHEENCALARTLGKARVDGPKLRIQWLASGAGEKKPGTWFKAETNIIDKRRVFHLFMPAPSNNRSTVKASLIRHLEGFTQPTPGIRVEEITQ